MLRSNLHQKKRRARKTRLLFGEGLDEEMFLRHLKSLYARDIGVQIKICRGRGGSADGIVADADRLPGAYDTRIVILDCDKSRIEMDRARDAAKIRNIILLENNPCLESMLLAILNDGKIKTGMNSDWCKREFESHYMTRKKRNELQEYKKVFSKSLLDRQRRNVAELDNLISIIQGR